MSLDNLEAFREAVWRDPALQATLRDTTDSRDFAALMVRLGRERGYEFSERDVAEALRGARRAWQERWL
jgi:predicted ribosomally synthesized peptide with nif11-like leader